jgi:hypothetical protein
MSDEKKPFTVTDRRHFTREGDVREPGSPVSAEAPAPAAPAPAASAPAATAPPPPRREERSAPDPARGQAESSYRQAIRGAALEDDGAEPLDFVGLLLSLGTQASMMLGMGARPGERAPAPDLAGARSMISLLEILRDKTEGRRTPEEEEVLEGLLYELRMQYVALTRKAGP